MAMFIMAPSRYWANGTCYIATYMSRDSWVNNNNKSNNDFSVEDEADTIGVSSGGLCIAGAPGLEYQANWLILRA